jgi:hypothetical protein
LLQQLRGLMSNSELRGLVARLRPTVPQLTLLAQRNVELFNEQRSFSSCFNEVIVPWSHSTVEAPPEYPLEIGGRTFETTGYSFTGSAGESRNGDAAGQHLRVLAGSGTNLVRFGEINGRDQLFGLTPLPLLGAIPRITDSKKTVMRPGVPCERQEPPNLEAGIGSPPEQGPAPTAAPLSETDGPGAERLLELVDQLSDPDSIPAARLESVQRMIDTLGFSQVDLERLRQESD